MAMTQRDHFYKSHRHVADMDQAFMDMVNDKDQPITSLELRTLIWRKPEVWKRFEHWVPILKKRDRERMIARLNDVKN